MRLCSINGCGKEHHAKGYCMNHYQQNRERDIYTFIKTKPRVERKCTVKGCLEKHYQVGYCAKHHYQFIGRDYRKKRSDAKRVILEQKWSEEGTKIHEDWIKNHEPFPTDPNNMTPFKQDD